MGSKPATREVGQLLAALAAGQRGVFSRPQALDAGVSARRLRRLVGAGWLRRIHRGVYALAGSSLTWRGRWLAAVLACGDSAVLSHRHAAALWADRADPELELSDRRHAAGERGVTASGPTALGAWTKPIAPAAMASR